MRLCSSPIVEVPVLVPILSAAVLALGGFGLVWAQTTAGDSGSSSVATNFLSVVGVGSATAGIGMALQAVGTYILKPWLEDRREQRKLDFEARRTDEKLAEAQAAVAANRQRIEATEAETERVRAEYAARLAELEAKFNDKERGERKLIDQLTELTAQNASETNKNIELAHLLLEREGRVLPLLPAAGTVISDEGPPLDGPRVLVVEDNPKAAKPLTVQLEERAGCHVETVSTLAEGLAALGRGPDVVLLDLMLPDGDGIEILRRIKDERLPIRVIVTTGKDEASLGPVKALGPEAVFQKPFRLEKLLSLLQPPTQEAAP
jgi:CheY-like chemotaxis protein